MSLGDFVAWEVGLGFPRVSGDEPLNKRGAFWVVEFSPRERG